MLIYRADLYAEFLVIIALILAPFFLSAIVKFFCDLYYLFFDLLRILLFSNADVDLDCG